MNHNQPQISQIFMQSENLYRRVRRSNMKPDGKATFLAFELPDMSAVRGQCGSAEEARRGFNAEDWGVIYFLVRDIPTLEILPQEGHNYAFAPRHVPVPGNFAHSEVRVWRRGDAISGLVTVRNRSQFDEADPDRDDVHFGPDALDPDFHMRWRKRLEWRCEAALEPESQPED